MHMPRMRVLCYHGVRTRIIWTTVDTDLRTFIIFGDRDICLVCMYFVTTRCLLIVCFCSLSSIVRAPGHVHA